MSPLDPNGAAVSERRSGLRPLHLIVLLICGLVAFLDGFDVQMMSFVAPPVSRELNVEKEMMGLILSAAIAGMLVGMIGQGPLSDRVGRKPLIVICLAGFGVATLACSIVTSATELLLLRFIGGIGLGAVMPSVIVMVSEIAPPRLRSRMVVILGAGVPIGGLVCGALCALLLPSIGWRVVFLIGGILPLLLTPLVMALLPESPLFLVERAARGAGIGRSRDIEKVDALVRRGWTRPSAAERPGKVHGVRALFSSEFRRITLVLWLIFAANMMLFYSVLGWMPSILTSSGVPEHLAAWAGAMLNLGVVVGSFPLGWAADRFGIARVLTLSFAVGAGLFCVSGLMLGAPLGVVLVLCAMLGAISGGGQLLLNAFAGAAYPTACRATGIGLAGMAGRAGAMVGPVACGVLLSAGVVEGVLLAMLAVPALIAALACASLRPQVLPGGASPVLRAGEGRPT